MVKYSFTGQLLVEKHFKNGRPVNDLGPKAVWYGKRGLKVYTDYTSHIWVNEISNTYYCDRKPYENKNLWLQVIKETTTKKRYHFILAAYE